MSQLKFTVDNGTKDITSLDADELAALREVINGLPLHERTPYIKKLMLPIVPAFQIQITSPIWLKSDFDAPIWECKFGTRKKTIDFNVLLEDEVALTDPKHHKLLYTLKYWYCSQTHPFYCGGRNMKSTTAYWKIISCLHFTDALLLRADHFKLSEHGLKLFTENDALALLESLMDIGIDGLYQSASRLTNFFLQPIAAITDEDIATATKKYPNIIRKTDETLLELTDKQIIKARVWLLNQGAFRTPSSTQQAGNWQRSSYLHPIYKNTLHGGKINGNSFNELRITPLASKAEYQAISVTNRDEDGMGIQSAKRFLSTLKSLSVVTGDDFVGVPTDSLKRLSLKDVIAHFKPKDIGRFRTLPLPVVFTVLKKAFEYCFKYMDDILVAIEKYHRELPSYPHLLCADTNSPLKSIDENNFSSTLKKLGVQYWRLVDPNNNAKLELNFYDKLRDNQGLIELYEVLMGSVQVIIGTLMARRVSELLSLSATCLHPKSDPTDPKNRNTNYSIQFYNSKSGAGDTREKLIRPIPKSGAQLIWKLQQFRLGLIKMGASSNKTGLFLTCCRKNGKLTAINSTSYNQNFDIFCDYFETPLLETLPNEFQRYYIRQHQLRRFFAMSFFWSSGFDGLDTLRYFLGHTDAEHLYHYITENTPGEILRGVKAQTLVHGLNSEKITGIEELRVILKERLKVQDVTVEALDNLIEELQYEVEDGYIKTTPELEKLRYQLEESVGALLNEGMIDLQPKFCIVQDENGKTIQDIYLVVIVREVRDECVK